LADVVRELAAADAAVAPLICPIPICVMWTV
jgi:hypothetical protein